MFVKLATDEDGNVKVNDDGNPLYLDKNNKEVPVDVPKMYQKILDLGNENKTHRETNEEFKSKFSMFDEVEDIAEWYKDASKAIETVKTFDTKDYQKIEKVEAMKTQMKEAHENDLANVKQSFEQKIVDLTKGIEHQQGQVRKLLVSKSFASSPLFSGDKPKTSLDPAMAEAFFGSQIKVEEDENGEPVTRCFFADGTPVFSVENPGEPAGFEEGIVEIWEKYPNKARYTPSADPGSGGGGGGNADQFEGDDDLKSLQVQYAKAVKEKRGQDAIAIKNKIHAIRMKNRNAA